MSAAWGGPAAGVWEHTWSIGDLLAAQRGRAAQGQPASVAVVLPALNEEATVGEVVASVAGNPVVTDLVVVDSGSTDRTVERARAAGARVAFREDAEVELPVRPGKGEVLWRALALTDADILVYLDADLIDPSPSFVPGLLGPLLLGEGVEFVKGVYRRPLTQGEGKESPTGGGRVTELLAKPLLAAVAPELSFLVQPLGGEYAATRRLLERVPFAAGYGVEIGLLLDAIELLGSTALTQVNLGVRRHRNRPLHELAAMAREIVATVLPRRGIADSGVPLATDLSTDDVPPRPGSVVAPDRPPLAELRSRLSTDDTPTDTHRTVREGQRP